MQTTVSTERGYTVGYFKPGTKLGYGISVSVSGDKKNKVIREARELLEQVQDTALEVHANLFKEVKIESEVQEDG